MIDVAGGCNPLLRAFNPTSLALTSWLRSGATSGDVTTWPDALGGAGATANAARAPTAQSDKGLSFNGATPDVMGETLGAHNFHTGNLTRYIWVKPTGVTGNQTIYSIHIGAGGASARVLEIKLAGAALRIDIYVSGANGRRFTYNSMFSAGVARLIGLEFNSGGATEADKVVATRSGVILTASSVINLGSGGAITTLVSATGRALFGNFRDDATPSDFYTGLLGPNSYCRAGSAMAGATAGNMLQSARDALNAFEPLA